MHTKLKYYILSLLLICLFSCKQKVKQNNLVLDESGKVPLIVNTITIDSVWSGHPANFSIYTKGNHQFVAYYNANRNIVVAQRKLDSLGFKKYQLPATTRETANGTSTVLGWDSHNYLELIVDSLGYIHLSGNMHINPITYFKSEKPYDVTTLKQQYELIGSNEDRCTYPRFTTTKEGNIVFQYRDGGSGDGNEIYNLFDVKSQEWSRLLDRPLTDGMGKMNAYQSKPMLLEDGWYHVYWVWRDTPDCATNHDLSYMKSPDLKKWYTVSGEQIDLPATLNTNGLIVDPIPVNGGIINLAAKLVLDKDNNPVFVYHKYDEVGNLQLYVAYLEDGTWKNHTITNWEYRWEFSGFGSIDFEVLLKEFNRRADGRFEVGYYHKAYGEGTILLDKDLKAIGSVIKPESLANQLDVEGNFPGLVLQTLKDGSNNGKGTLKYLLKWETLNNNRDLPREKPWPKPSVLKLYELKGAQ